MNASSVQGMAPQSTSRLLGPGGTGEGNTSHAPGSIASPDGLYMNNGTQLRVSK